MQTTIVIERLTKHWREYDIVVCEKPCCHGLTDDGEILYGDYTSKPMIWCWDCDSGYVLDLPLTFDGEDLAKLNPIDKADFFADHDCDDADHCGETTVEAIREGSEYKAYTVSLLYITRVTPNNLSPFTSERKMSVAEMEELVDYTDANENDDCDPCACDGQQLVKYPWITVTGEPHTGRIWSDDFEFHYNFNLSLPCESYDIGHPKEEYPEWAHMDHDGGHIFVEFLERDGRIGCMFFSGD